MKLILTRHGETMENVQKITQGQSIGTLSSLGLEQAKKLSARLQNDKIDFIYSSDLKRTKDTVSEILKHHHCPVIYDELLRERSKGEFEGKPEHEYFQDLKTSGLSEFVHKPSGGESMGDVYNRADQFLRKIIDIHNDSDTILICTHGGWLNMFMARLLEYKNDNIFVFQFSNTSITIVEIVEGKPTVKLLNCIKHLA